MSVRWDHKDPDEVIDYQLNWTPRLAGDDIATSVWIVPEGLTAGVQSTTSRVTTLWLSGGTLGSDYEILNRVTTAGGRVMDQTVRLAIMPK